MTDSESQSPDPEVAAVQHSRLPGVTIPVERARNIAGNVPFDLKLDLTRRQLTFTGWADIPVLALAVRGSGELDAVRQLVALLAARYDIASMLAPETPEGDAP